MIDKDCIVCPVPLVTGVDCKFLLATSIDSVYVRSGVAIFSSSIIGVNVVSGSSVYCPWVRTAKTIKIDANILSFLLEVLIKLYNSPNQDRP